MDRWHYAVPSDLGPTGGKQLLQLTSLLSSRFSLYPLSLAASLSYMLA